MRSKPGFLRALGVLIAGLLIAGCSGVRPQPPEVSLKRLQVAELSLSHANLLADLRIYNPNLIALTLEQFDYTLILNGIKVSSGHSLEPTTVASHGYGDLTVKLSAAYLDLLRLIQLDKQQKSFKYTLQGNIRVGGLGFVSVNYPLLQSGEIHIER